MQIQGTSLAQTQTQKLSPQMLQTVKLMTMPLIDLRETISQELENNPALEADLKEPQSEVTEILDTYSTADPDLMEERSDTDYKYSRETGDVNDFLSCGISKEKSLIEHLMEQLSLVHLSPEEREIGELLINNLNSKGYHLYPPIELLSNRDPELVREMIEVIQGFDPVGICVTNLEESLLIQAKIDGTYPDYTLDILENDLDLLALGKRKAIQDKYNLEKEDFEEILEYLRSLNPHPTSQFSDSLPDYIIPEARIFKEGKDIKVYLRNETIPSLSINKDFEEFTKTDNKETIKFVKKRINEANSFIQSLEMRNQTLIKTLKSIVQKQREFFLFGPGNIKPLTRKEIALETNLSESTISRISTDKYVQTEWGIFNIKYFFSSSIQSTVSGMDLSKESVKEMVRKIIIENKSQKKLSDQQISNILKEKGIEIARRTVSKYRAELNLLSSFERQ